MKAIWTLLLFLFVFLETGLLADEPTYQTKVYREQHGLGLKPKTEKSKSFLKALPRHASLSDDVSVPGKWDLTPKVSPPENQGSCGSCWDFSLTKALRSAYMLKGRDPGVLAWNFLLNNCGKGPKMWGCGGGLFEAGESFLNGGGPWLDSQDPYTEREGRCKTGLPVAGTAIQMVSVGGDNPSFKQLAEALYGDGKGHMLSIDVAVAGNWGSYSGGIYNGNGSGINHMINGNGYDCETSVNPDGTCKFNSQGEPVNGDGYLIVMNNWGNSWGERGYMRTRAHRNQIASTAVYFEVDVPNPPVDGGWSAFGAWSDCVDGKQSHSRSCNSPAPANGGKDCVGHSVETQACLVPPVPPSPSNVDWKLILMLVTALVSVAALVVALVRK